jgi:hypothetical protein
MFFAHLHLYLNHAPAMGLGFGLVVLLYGLWRKNCEVVRASFLVLVLAGLTAIPVYLTGESAERAVQGLPDVPDKTLIHEHEDTALYGLISICVTGAAALAALWLLYKKKECKANITVSILILAALSLAILVRVGQLGGTINHPELRPGYVMPAHVEEDD